MTRDLSLLNKILKSSAQLFTGNIIGTITGVLSGFFFAKLLGPEQYGVWQTAFTISGYSVLLMLSLPVTMTRDYVHARKAGDLTSASQMANIVFTYSLAIRFLAIIIISCYSLFYISDYLFRMSMYAVATLFVFDIPTAFGGIMAKALNEYQKITWQKSIHGIGIMLTVPIVYYFKFEGLLLGVLFTHLIVGIYFYYARPVSYRHYWNTKLFFKLVSVAFPLFLVTATSLVFVSVDRLIIASYLSFADVGLYSLSSFLSTPLNLLISSFAIVLFTQLNQEYGSEVNRAIIRKHAIVPQQFFSLLLPLFMGIGLLALPLFVDLFLPQYQNGILAAQINIFSIYFFLMANFSGNALFTLKKQKYTALTFAISGILKVAISIFLIKQGYGIVGVALASVFAYFLYDISMLYIVFRQIEHSIKAYFIHLFQIVLPASIPLLMLLFQNQIAEMMLLNNFNPILKLIILELIFIVLMLPFLYKAFIFVKSKLKPIQPKL